jgi:hypothetical protein
MPTRRPHPPLGQPGTELLHDAVGSDAEMARIHTVQILFPTRDQAEEALDALYETLPVRADAVSIRPAGNETVTLHDPSFEDEATGTWRSAARIAGLGAVLGLLLGLTLELGLEPAVAAGLLTFALGGFGAIAGALVGVARSAVLDDDPLVLVTPGDAAVVVTVRHLRPARPRRLLEAYGGSWIETPTPGRG